MLRSTPAVPLELFSAPCESIRFWSEKSFGFSTKWLRFVACWFSFTLRWNGRVKIKLRSDAFLKFLFKIRLKQETNLMQACSANQLQVIMPSWLPKVPSWLRKNALCLSQSAFSNFALHVISRLSRYRVYITFLKINCICTLKIGHSSPVLTRSHIAVPHKKKRSLVQAESRECCI